MNKIKGWVRAILFSACGGAASLMTTRAHASDLADKTELALQTTALSYYWSKNTSKTTSGDGPVSSEQTTSGHTLGISGSGWGVRIGHVFGEHLLLADDLSFSHYHGRSGDFTSNSNSVGVAPRAEWLFGSGSVRPFVAAIVGYNHLWSATDSGPSWTSHGSGLTVGGAVGAHLSVAGAWSVDPELRLGHEWDRSTSDMHADSPLPNYEGESSTEGTEVTLNIALAGWF